MKTWNLSIRGKSPFNKWKRVYRAEMLEKLYNDRILALAESLNRDDRLDDPQATVTLDSPLCGSRIRVDLILDGDHVAQYGQQVRACALGQSAAAIMKKLAPGRDEAELTQIRDIMQAMLKQDGPPPGGDWAELAILEPARAHKSRHASIMLPFNAILKAIAEIKSRADQNKNSSEIQA